MDVDCDELLSKDSVDSAELEVLLKAREAGECDFLLVDVREPFEYEAGHIPGVDLLRPTSTFQHWARELAEGMKDRTLVITCRTANRSYQVQQILRRMGHPRVIDHAGGIVSWRGPIEKGRYGGD
ncbi:rhodanese-like domain-containing protein [Nitratifractor sp.]